MSPSISYSLTVCNEFIEVQRLVHFLLRHKRPQDNIVILYDEANGDPEVETFLRTHSVNNEFMWSKGHFDRDFASWKNKLIDMCNKDFICNLDADEIPHENLIKSLPAVLELNPSIDAYWVPRINTLSGDENEIDTYVNQIGWTMNEQKHINFPDPQLRIFRRDPNIRWEGKVHETIKGYETISRLPFEEEWSLYHPKTFQKQLKQNNLYAGIN